MLTDEGLSQLCHRLGLTERARSIIDAIRSSPPARRVQGASGNVSVRYPSRKMGVTIQAESHRNELAGVYEKEHDPETLEFYDQSLPIKLTYQAKNGQSVGVRHTPDYFVIRIDSVGWEEWKTEGELGRLVDKMPNRYVRGEDGRWRCPPGERYARELGFFYRVRSSAEIDWIYQRNLVFLEDYLRADCPAVDEAIAAAIIALVTSQPGIRLDELLDHLTREGDLAGARTDVVHTLIATARLYVDPHASALAEPERVRVFRDVETSQANAVVAEASCQSLLRAPTSVSLGAGSPVVWDGRRWVIVNTGETLTSLLAADGVLVELPNSTLKDLLREGKLVGSAEQTSTGLSPEAREHLIRASPEDIREANRRYAIIAPCLTAGLTEDATAATAAPTPARTVRRWLHNWRKTELIYGSGYIGLLPRCRERGNHQPKLPEATLALLDEFIAKDYETLKQKRRFEVYAALVRACEAKEITPPSYKTFTQAANLRPSLEQTEKRKGRRAAYQHSPFYWELTFTTPRHGDRPFEIGHIDHTQLDVELVCSRTGRSLGRPWLTFLTDAFSRRLLALYLTFDPPSYRSCMMVLRECVSRHQRLPQSVVTDGGPEFQSVYFETLLARYECAKKTRPSGQPRLGSVCERLFGTTNTRFIHNLVGNTQVLQNVRQVTKAVDPIEHARWTFGRLYARLREWTYEVYDTTEHPALGTSPREAFQMGLLQSGGRLHRLIPDDQDYRMFTLPTTPRGTAKLQARLGVKINYIYYWSDAFLDPEVEGTQVPIRFDPFDAGLAYAFVKSRWVRCISEHYARFAGRSEKELMLASAELRQRSQRHSRQFTLTARKLADFLASLEAQEVLLEQRLKDAEAKSVLSRLEGSRVSDRGQTPTDDELKETGQSREAQRAPESRLPGQPPTAGAALVIYEDY